MPDINQPAPLGFGGTNPAQNAPVPETAWSASETRLAREKKASTGDYFGSIWRQDGLVDGLVAYLAGKEMTPDPHYNPFTDPSVPELQKGLWPDFQNELYKAHSAAHAAYIKDRLLQKQEDLTRMGDMGWGGTAGRLALNAVMPDQILIAMIGGGVTRMATAVKAAGAARKLTALGEAATAAERAAAQSAKRASPGAVALGVGSGAAQNAAYERLRQSVNFEDDSTKVLEAGLMGAFITLPFALREAKVSGRAAAAASKEHDVLAALKAVEDGHELTPAQGKLIAETHEVHTAIRDFESGKIDGDALEKRLGEFVGPVEPVDRWMARYSDDLRAKGQSIIDELFPNRGEHVEVPPKGEPSPMPRSHAEEAAAVAPAVADAKGGKAARAERVAAAAAAPAPTAMELAFKRALKARVVKAQEREAARKAFDLEEASAAGDAAKRAERKAAFDQAEKDRQAAQAADFERAINAREEARMLASEDPLAAPREEPAVDPAAPAAALAKPAGTDPESFVGKDVSWAGPEGDTIAGTVRKWNAEIGKLIVETDEGMKAVHPAQLDTHEHAHAPSGFLAGSVGSAQIEKVASVMAQRTKMAEMTIGGHSFPTRFDIYSYLNGSPVERVRKLAYRLVKDAIQNDTHEAQAMTASEWKKQLQRTYQGQFHRVAGEAFDEARKAAQVPVWRKASFAHEFYGLVSRVTRGDAKALADNPLLAPMLEKAAGAQRKFYAGLIDEMKRAGVKGADSIEPNDFYVNRVWHHGNLRAAAAMHGDDALHELVASAIQNKKDVIERFRKSPGNAALTDEQILRKKARGFLGAIRALEYNPALREIQLHGRDMGTLRRELLDMQVPESHIDDLVDLMFEVRPQDGDAGRAANLKFRFALDETARTASSKGELRLSDLFENDARMLVDVYGNSMAGHVGLAKHGIDSQAAWARELKLASDEASAAGADPTRVAKDMALLDNVHRNIIGRPMSTADFSASARAAAAFRGYTRGVMLPQLGIAAFFEMSKAVSMFGFRSMLRQMPSLRNTLVMLRKGYIPDEGLARQMMILSGFGNEKASAYHRMQEIESGYFGQALTRAEMGANRVSHAVDVMSGNASFTSLTRQLSSMMAVQQMHEFASGLRKLTPKLRERWVGQGISDDDIEAVLGSLKEHSTAEGGVVKEIRYEDWQQASPKTYEKFQTFVSRQVRDAIQDHDLGETMPFMHTTIGKILVELKTFFLVAHAKNFLKNGYYHDAAAMQVFALGFIGEAMAYMTQSALNYPTQLEEKLQPDRIATAAFFRMPVLGTPSMLVESGYNILSGGESLVQPGMTTNTDNRSLFNTPSLIVAKRIGSAVQTLGGMANPNAVTTSREARDLLGSLPGTNLIGLKAAGQYWAETFPKSDPAHKQAPR